MKSMSASSNIFSEIFKSENIRKKIIYTIFMLLLFRLGCNIAVPFIDSSALQFLFGTGSTIDYLNMMSGGALATSTVFALGVSPYINASIVVQLLSVVFPYLEKAKKDGDGKEKMEKYTKVTGLIMSLVMSIGYYLLLRNYGALAYTQGISGIFTAVVTIATFVAGSQIVVWIGDKIDEYGIGNGVSLIIFAGIIARWRNIYAGIEKFYHKISSWNTSYEFLSPIIAVVLVGGYIILSIYFVVFVSDAEKKIFIIYPNKNNVKQIGGQATYLPMKMIMGGVIPVIFTSTIIGIPQMISILLSKEGMAYKFFNGFDSSNAIYCILYATLIFYFNNFYTSIQYDPIEIANNMRQHGATIPGIRPGKPTSDYLISTMNKLSCYGSIALILITMTPIVIGNITNVPIQMGGTSLLIISGVAVETVKKIDSILAIKTNKQLL